MDSWTQWGKEGLGLVEKVALIYIYIYTYTLSCVKHIAGDKLVYNTGNPAWYSVVP